MLAHEGEDILEVIEPSLDQIIRGNSVKYALVALLLLGILTTLSIFNRNKSEFLKYLLFAGFILVSILTTVYLAGSTIYLNQKSLTGGPVHYHADFEIFNCGQQVELKAPEGLSNKIGSEVVHEHNDKRIHIEGVILNEHDASLGHFFATIGGQLHQDHIAVPTQNGLLELENGQSCPDGQRAFLQVFVYKTQNNSFSQQKLDDPENYIISPFAQVPPGDCIIVEFDTPKDKTEKLCTFYQVAKDKGEIQER